MLECPSGNSTTGYGGLNEEPVGKARCAVTNTPGNDSKIMFSIRNPSHSTTPTVRALSGVFSTGSPPIAARPRASQADCFAFSSSTVRIAATSASHFSSAVLTSSNSPAKATSPPNATAHAFIATNPPTVLFLVVCMPCPSLEKSAMTLAVKRRRPVLLRKSDVA